MNNAASEELKSATLKKKVFKQDFLFLTIKKIKSPDAQD